MNSDKCHLLISGDKHEALIDNIGGEQIIEYRGDNIGGEQIIEANKVKLLGIEIDSDLSFTNHLNSVLGKVSKKLNALSRLCVLFYLSIVKEHLCMHL